MADLEGKLRELAQSRHISALCSPSGMAAILREAALAGLEAAIDACRKFPCGEKFDGRYQQGFSESLEKVVIERVIEAIRALKEKV